MPTAARPDLAIYEEIVRMEPHEVVAGLVGIRGKKITAYLAAVKDTRTIDAWLEPGLDQDQNRKLDLGRLRVALQVARLLATSDSNGVVQAWFGGLNPQLGDRNPSRLLREGSDADQKAVLNAARAFF